MTLPANMSAADYLAWRRAGEPAVWPQVTTDREQRSEVKRERRRDEDALQRSVVEWLELVTPRLAHPWAAVPNGGRRSRIEAAIMQGLGVRAGAPDLAFVAAGLELKRPGGGSLSPSQREFRRECERRGVPYLVARSLDEAIARVTEAGLLR